MFLDPDPKRQSKNDPNASMSGFFSSQRPIESPRDHRTSVRRKALLERSPSRNNQQNPWTPDPNKPTVRIVKPSPPTQNSSSDSDDLPTSDSSEKENRHNPGAFSPRLPVSALVKPASASKPGFPGSAASSQDRNVSDFDRAANGAQSLARSDTDSLLSTTLTHADTGLRTGWHRRSGSTGNASTSSTLKESTASVFGQKSVGDDNSRLSQGTTLRGTPTPYEQEHRERLDAEESAVKLQASGPPLDTLPEASPERSTTVRVVQPVESDSSEHPLRSEPSDSSIVVRLRGSPQSTSDSDQRPAIPRRSSRRSSSTSSLPAPLNIRRSSGDSRTPRNQRSQESIAQSEATLPAASSPNFVAYSSSPQRPRSGTHPLHSNLSLESIDSRLQYPTVVRPETGRSLATSSSWASLQPESSTDTLPPLQVPKKRLRHKPASLSLKYSAKSSAYASGSSRMAEEDIDTLPYPREPFSSHLSTIASESERTQSRTTSQQLSHFSLGSGVLTGDDASSIPLSGTWPRRRRESAPIDSIVSDSSPGAPTSSEEEPGDMTLGVFRAESAKPQPLQPRSQSSPGAPRVYDGPLPPIPPIPKSRDSEENFDKVSELHSPKLREKRSGYSLRRRSNSTPSRSHSRHMSQVSRSESDRWSHASSIFPQWAKQFYGHGATLMSASKVSLSTHTTPQQSRNGNGQGHARNDSQWTERSITSRLGTGYSEIESTSPTSSHFLPSIFRPRTRGRANTEDNRRSRHFLQKKRPRRSNPGENRPDSMTIFNDPLPRSRSGDNGAGQGKDVLPSGQPKWGQLKDSSSEQKQPHRPLPRKYSKQRKWDEMEFPRPMTKDRLSDFHDMSVYDPRLAPTARSSRYRLSIWRAPSFVESLDTLWRSRCNRQILLFALGFIFPPCWLLGAVLPIPKKPMTAAEYEKERSAMGIGASEEDIQAAMMKHEAGDAEKRWREERAWMKGRWWRWLNRVMSVVGVLVVGAVVSS